jgi:SAM-dependent methyltransferase
MRGGAIGKGFGVTPDTFNRLHSLRMENDAHRYAMEEMCPRFDRMAGRHENGTAPRAVSAFNLFQTPVALAARMAELLALGPGARILEPSAGLGRLLDAVKPYAPSEIVAVELTPQLSAELYRQEREGVTLKQGDFLNMTPADLGTFDAVIMNPPFHMRSDIRHIEHARQFLKPGGKLIAIMAGPRRDERLKPFAAHWERLEPGTFKETGTRVDACLLVIEA